MRVLGASTVLSAKNEIFLLLTVCDVTTDLTTPYPCVAPVLVDGYDSSLLGFLCALPLDRLA